MKIYISHQITGLTFDEANNYFLDVKKELSEIGYEVLSPMTGKGYLRAEGELEPTGYKYPSATDHALFERDKWMVTQADVVYVNLDGLNRVSIGCVMELAWASLLGKHTVSVINTAPNDHAFNKQASDIIFTSHREAMDYFKKLIKE